jgi:hypothetical protein
MAGRMAQIIAHHNGVFVRFEERAAE